MSLAPPPPTISLKGRALRLLAAREHSRTELQRKLQAHEAEPGELAQVLDALQAKGFIDEQRVLESVLQRRSASLGGLRIRQELQAKGLDKAAVNAALSDLQGSEMARAQALWQKKFGQAAADASARAKQQRFLISRGFSGDTVAKVLRRGAEQPDLDESH
jgi:regulatory protein